jgi:hypothetical protein
MWGAAVLGALGTGLLIAPSVGSAAPAVGSAAASSGGVVTAKAAGAVSDAATVLRYWTPQRMAAAKPMTKTVSGSPTGAGAPSAAASGSPQAVGGQLPGGAKAPAAALVGSAAGPSAQTFSYPFPFTRFTVFPKSLWKTYPYRVNGKIFFTQNGGSYVCSGTSVTAPSGSRVWTAGHCLNDGATHWSTNVVFVPAYNGTSTYLSVQRPFGTWAAIFSTQTVPTSWDRSHDFSRDLGAFTVSRNSNGNTLAQVVGTDGFAWNQARDQQYVDFGYPQAAPFNGQSLTECIGATAAYDTGIGGSGPAPQGIGCDMTGGSSGGAWNIAFSGSGPGYINGHNDYKYTSSQPLAMYSPYFDTLANTVRCTTEGC